MLPCAFRVISLHFLRLHDCNSTLPINHLKKISVPEEPFDLFLNMHSSLKGSVYERI